MPRRAASATAESVAMSELRRHKSPPANLTPAGAVAHAYKQQEQRRSELAEMSGWNEQSGQSSRGTPPTLEEEDEEGRAYYTVLGSSAGRVVAVGSAEDSTWELGYDSRYSMG